MCWHVLNAQPCRSDDEVAMNTEPQRVRGFDKGRFETLSGGIFAVAPTLLVLEHIHTTPAVTAGLNEK
jgi:hypothetical protein